MYTSDFLAINVCPELSCLAGRMYLVQRRVENAYTLDIMRCPSSLGNPS